MLTHPWNDEFEAACKEDMEEMVALMSSQSTTNIRGAYMESLDRALVYLRNVCTIRRPTPPPTLTIIYSPPRFFINKQRLKNELRCVI